MDQQVFGSLYVDSNGHYYNAPREPLSIAETAAATAAGAVGAGSATAWSGR